MKRQETRVKLTNEAHSCNHCYRGKAIIIKYSECLFLALGIQHAKRIPVRFYSIVLHYLINGRIFEKKKKYERKMCVSFSILRLSETFLVLIRTEGMYIGLRVKYPLFLSYFNETRIFPKNFENINFH